MISRTPLQRCPHCDHLLDAQTGISPDASDDAMKPYDLSVCIYCANYLQMDLDMRLVKLSDEEFIALPLENRRLLIRAQETIRKMRQ